MDNIKVRIALYLSDLTYRCNTLNKGFSFLLMDDEFIFEEGYEELTKYIEDINLLINNFGYSDIEERKQKYFFKHLYYYFKYNMGSETNEVYKLTKVDRNACILSSIASYVQYPIDYLISILNKNYKNPNEIIISLRNERFKKLFSYQSNANQKNAYFSDYSKHLNKNHFPQDKQYLYNKIINILDRSDNYDFYYLISLICEVYEKDIESKNELNDIRNQSSDKVISSSNNSDKIKEELDKITDEKNKQLNVANKFEGVLNNFFNPMESYIDKAYDRYSTLSDKMRYESKDCRSIKSILYLMTYLLKDKNNKDFNAAKYINEIINADIGWAVGDENNKEASFYGDSDLAKFIYGYYSYMTGKENPYTDLINNKIIKEMDYNAIMINKYFKDNGFLNVLFEDNKLKDVYNLLVNFRDLVKIIDSPITLTGTYDNFISGIISSMLNSAATVLDFSISSVVKSLFYVEIVPIEKKRYSLANLYNYIHFIKLILESSGEYQNISYIDREEFVNQAYEILGINKDSLKRIGYLAYNKDLNNIASVNMYDEDLFQNKNNSIFTVRNDMKLLYSLIQFGVQKKSVLTGDINYESKFSFGDEYAVNDILNYLTDTEIYYVFTIYNINMWTLNDKLGSLTNDEILDFNKNLLFIDGVYDHHNTNFYNVYLSKSPNKIYEEMNDYDFKNTNYKILISNMLNYYKKILKYNKQQLDTIVFESNDISDIDDFFVRFIPSITELLKLFGQNTDSIKGIAKFLDTLLLFISDALFRNLFINVKISLNNLLKKYTDDMFKSLESLKGLSSTQDITIDFNFGDSKFMQSVDLIIDLIEKGNFNLFSIQSCFGEVSQTEDIYDPMEYDDLIFNHGHNSISRNEFFDDANGSLDQSYIGAIEKEDIIIENNTQHKSDSDIIMETIVDHYSSDNKKIYYEKGDILIEKNDGSVVVAVSKNDRNTDNITFIEYPDIVEKNLSKDSYQQLIEIRDYIDNITNKEILSLNKQLSNEKDKLKIEMNKNIPNYNSIKNINKNIQELTSTINDVKKENRILSTESDSVIIKDFQEPIPQHSENIYSSLDDFFKTKKEILKEVNNIVIDNEVVLTNYQITELLK